MDLLEDIGRELDCLAAHLYGGLCRLEAPAQSQKEARKSSLDQTDTRLLQALQGICMWSLAAVGRAVGYQRLSANVLWEWCSSDAVWALVLAKGVLTVCPDAERHGIVAIPDDLHELQRALLTAVLGLASPNVAFAAEVAGLGENTAEEATIAMRNMELARHRAGLAAAATDCRIPQALVGMSARHSMAAALVAFLVALLQPENVEDPLRPEPEWQEQSFAALDVIEESRRAAHYLSFQLRKCAGIMWCLLGEVPVYCSGRLPPDFLQDCADFAHFVPPPEPVVCEFIGQCLAQGVTVDTGHMTVDTVAIAPLCVVASSAGVAPDDIPQLVETMVRLSAAERAVVVAKWDAWKGPLAFSGLGQWAAVLQSETSVPPSAESVPYKRALPPPPNLPPPPPPPAAPTRGPALQALVRDAPNEFRCAFDGQLLMDPVQSPTGHIFERSALAYALADCDGLCPITGQPLAIGDCKRLPELRKRIAQWVRGQRQQERSKPQLRA
eukprot:gnl/TRDRNA2_/TRDRNA2_92581_c0_seq1.p1 gnl/TRDRNA2_/TRDRNA2_92581_c0~~gnl/TRDRNA2_/TRDRNA2_92581_c0_seq1.p1  ORF type:complete len:550 (-),score=107.26 gnl/TRDRNA2_/TRDRNA2_92581_c0_seq1:34-1527(-)